MGLKDQIIKNLESNGFPTKKVALPLEKMYEVADSKGENLNKVLDELKAQGIDHEKNKDKIIFKNAFPNLDPNAFSKVKEMMDKMDPEELQKMQEKVAQMSDEEKEKLMQQAKAMGLF